MVISRLRRWLEKISESKRFSYFRRKIVVFRSFMSRSYAWIQSPGFVLILVGVMKPYIQPYWDISVIWLALIALFGMSIIGYLERYLGFYKEASSYNTSQNPLLLNRLAIIEDKIDKVIDDNKQRVGDNSSVQDNKCE